MSLPASSILSTFGWLDFVVEVLYGFLVNPGPCLSVTECSKFTLRLAFTLKNVRLEVWDLVEDTSCGTCGRGIRANDVGALWLILMPLKTRPVTRSDY